MPGDGYLRLIEHLNAMGPTAVAFSGGTDSTLLIAAAHDAYGPGALALTAAAPQVASRDIAETVSLAGQVGVRHHLVDLPLLDSIRHNPADRCYLCKRAMFTRLLEAADGFGIHRLMDGTNRDDLSMERPGIRVLRELNVASPLAELGITKAEIREMSHRLGLPNWGRSSDACLMTRLPVDTKVTDEDLWRIEAAEGQLIERGFHSVRVRTYGDLARIEVEPGERGRVLEEADAIVESLQAFGYRRIALDLQGYGYGSMDRRCKDSGGNPAPGDDPARRS